MEEIHQLSDNFMCFSQYQFWVLFKCVLPLLNKQSTPKQLKIHHFSHKPKKGENMNLLQN